MTVVALDCLLEASIGKTNMITDINCICRTA
jgi:hypothetical protein